MTRDEFLNLTWQEYDWKSKGYFKAQERDWEKYHWVVYNTIALNAKKGSYPSTFKSYLQSLRPRPKLTEEEIKERNRRGLYLQQKARRLERFRDEQNR